MIFETKFTNLKTELSNAIVAFEKVEGGYKLYFNNHSGFQEFKHHLSHLYYEFINELRGNLISLKTDEEVHIYLEMLLHVFDILDEQIGEFPDFTSPHRNAKMVSKMNAKLTCIYTNTEELSQLLACFKCQKKIIQKSIKFIRFYRKKCIKSPIKTESPNQSWQEELRDFYPHVMRLKDELNCITSITDKINHLQEERVRLSTEMKKIGKDIYNSPINLFFETRLDSFKDLLLLEYQKDTR